MLYDATMIEKIARDQRQREQQFNGVIAEAAEQADQVMAAEDRNNVDGSHGEETKMITTTNCNGVGQGHEVADNAIRD